MAHEGKRRPCQHDSRGYFSFHFIVHMVINICAWWKNTGGVNRVSVSLSVGRYNTNRWSLTQSEANLWLKFLTFCSILRYVWIDVTWWNEMEWNDVLLFGLYFKEGWKPIESDGTYSIPFHYLPLFLFPSKLGGMGWNQKPDPFKNY